MPPQGQTLPYSYNGLSMSFAPSMLLVEPISNGQAANMVYDRFPREHCVCHTPLMNSITVYAKTYIRPTWHLPHVSTARLPQWSRTRKLWQFIWCHHVPGTPTSHIYTSYSCLVYVHASIMYASTCCPQGTMEGFRCTCTLMAEAAVAAQPAAQYHNS